MAGKRKREKHKGEPDSIHHGTWYALEGGWAVRWTRHGKRVRQVFGRGLEKKLGKLSPLEAAQAIARLDAQVDAILASYDSLSDDEKAAVAGRSIVDVGTIVATAATTSAYYKLSLDYDMTFEELAAEFRAGFNYATDADAAKYDLTTASGWAHRAYDIQAKARQYAAIADKLAPIVPKLLAKPPKPLERADTLHGLLDLWRKSHPHSPDRKYVATIESVEEHVGKVAWRELTREQVRTWKNALENHHHAKGEMSAPTKKLDCLKGLYRAAIDAEQIEADASPVRGVIVRVPGAKKTKRRKGRPFSGKQLRTILWKARSWLIPLGRRELLWFLRVAIFHGVRPYELAQIRPNDVYTQSGVPVLHIRVTLPLGKKLQQGGKEGDERIIPLHPECAAFYEYARNVNGNFVFKTLTFSGKHGRAYWMSRFFGRFLRDTCGYHTADNTDRKLSLYSFRHSYRDAIRNARIDYEMGEVLKGHAGNSAHDNYGSGHALKLLAAEAEKIDPLSLGE